MTSVQGTVAHKCYQRRGEISLLWEYQVLVYEKCYLSLSALEYSVFSNLYMNPYARPTLIYSQLVRWPAKKELAVRVWSSWSFWSFWCKECWDDDGRMRLPPASGFGFVISVNLKCGFTCCYRSECGYTYRIVMHSIESQVSSAADKMGEGVWTFN
jgi:hypothetical protein